MRVHQRLLKVFEHICTAVFTIILFFIWRECSAVDKWHVEESRQNVMNRWVMQILSVTGFAFKFHTEVLTTPVSIFKKLFLCLSQSDFLCQQGFWEDECIRCCLRRTPQIPWMNPLTGGVSGSMEVTGERTLRHFNSQGLTFSPR